MIDLVYTLFRDNAFVGDILVPPVFVFVFVVAIIILSRGLLSLFAFPGQGRCLQCWITVLDGF